MTASLTAREMHPALLGLSIRLALLSAHYRKPLDWTEQRHADAQQSILRMHRALNRHYPDRVPPDLPPDEEVLAALGDDLNTPKAIARLHALTKAATRGDADAAARLAGGMALLGLLLNEDVLQTPARRVEARQKASMYDDPLPSGL